MSVLIKGHDRRGRSRVLSRNVARGGVAELLGRLFDQGWRDAVAERDGRRVGVIETDEGGRTWWAESGDA